MTKQLQKIIFEVLLIVCKKQNIKNNILEKNIEVFQTQNEKFGDFTSNILMILKRQNINILSQEFLDTLKDHDFIKMNVDNVEYVDPGFINFKIKEEFLIKNLTNFLKINKIFFKQDCVQKYLIEHTSPNTNKALHIGHLRNNVYAMATYRLLVATGNKVVLDCVYNDRGIHVCKAIWGYLKKDYLDKPIKEVIVTYKKINKEWWSPEKQNISPDSFVSECYKVGVLNEKEEINAQEIKWLLLEWENGNKTILNIWKKLNNWAYSGFKKTYKTIGSVHHYNWYESSFYKKSKQLIKTGLEKGVFVKLEDGAVLSDLKNYNLTDTILQRSDGTSMYFTQDIFLTQSKVNKFKADKYIWVVGKEQDLHFKQLFAICDQMNIGKLENFQHLNYGYVFWKDGKKMSSREGNVMSIDSLLQDTKEKVLELSKNQYKSLDTLDENHKNEAAFKIALGAIKYAMLKMDHSQDMFFDYDDILNIKSNGSPYVQYTYARIVSILNNSKGLIKFEKGKEFGLSEEEKLILRKILHFEEILKKSSMSFSPHLLINFLFEICKLYNGFYEKHKVLSNDQYQNQRLIISKAVLNIIKFSMDILGIDVIEKL